jgi:hypothetical protein
VVLNNCVFVLFRFIFGRLSRRDSHGVEADARGRAGRAGRAAGPAREPHRHDWGNGRARQANPQASLAGSGRVRRHSHHRGRSASTCGVSRGPRASWVRFPVEINTTMARKVVAGKGQVLFGQTKRQAAHVHSKLKVCITSNSYVSSLLSHLTSVVGLAGGLRTASGRNIGLAQLNVCKPPEVSHL